VKRDFFISYRGRDRQDALAIAGVLEEEGYPCILQALDMSPTNVEAVIRQNIAHAFRTSRVMIACFTREYPTSDFCQEEFLHAAAGNLWILKLEPVKIPVIGKKWALITDLWSARSSEQLRKHLLEGAVYLIGR
jgi:hypothetical protein